MADSRSATVNMFWLLSYILFWDTNYPLKESGLQNLLCCPGLLIVPQSPCDLLLLGWIIESVVFASSL